MVKRIHEANNSGISLHTLAKVNNVPYAELNKRLLSWRKLYGKRGPVTAAEFRKAVQETVAKVDIEYTNNNRLFRPVHYE